MVLNKYKENNDDLEYYQNESNINGSILDIDVDENQIKKSPTIQEENKSKGGIFRRDDPLLKDKILILLFALIFNMDSVMTFPFEPYLYQRYVKHIHPTYTNTQVDSLASNLKSIGDALPFIVAFISGPIIGVISDKIGRKKIIICLIGFILLDQLSMIMCYQLYVIWPMWVTHFINGFANNLTPIMYAVTADVTTKEERSSYCAFVGITMGLSIGISPLIGVSLMNWKTLSVVIVAFSCNVLGLLIVVPMKETIYYCNGLPITKEERAQISSKMNFSSKNPVKAIYYLFKSSLYIGLYAILYFAFSFSVMDSQNTAYLYINVRWDWGATQAGIITSIVGFSVVIWSGLANWMMKYISDRTLASLAFLVSAVFHILYGISVNGYMFSAVLGVGSFSLVLITILQSVISKATPGDMQAFVLTAVASLSSVASFVGAISSENLFAYFISDRAPFYFPGMHFVIDGGIIFLTFLFSVYIQRRFPVGCPEETCKQIETDTPHNDVTPLLSKDKSNNDDLESKHIEINHHDIPISINDN